MIAPVAGSGAVVLGCVVLASWGWLLLGHGGFWRARVRDELDPPPQLRHWPDIVAIVPARDEEDVIGRAVASLVAQDYPGKFSVIVVDDASSDGTGGAARDAAVGSGRVCVIAAPSLAPGWTGKLAAVAAGVAEAGDPEWLWLTDADIEHAPDTLRALVARGEAGGLTLVSTMALLRCTSLAERALIPAFVFFFQLLYPFARVNRPGPSAAAAGGCMLVRTRALAAAGGIGAVRDALIDDCAIGALLKRRGPIWLGLTRRSVSVRPYPQFGDVAAMISRSAYAQLGYSPVVLVAAIAGMALVYAAPPLLALFGAGAARLLGVTAWAAMATAFLPMLRFYRRGPLWAAALPLIAAFYAGCSLLSAAQHQRGRGGMWKGRVVAHSGGVDG